VKAELTEPLVHDASRLSAIEPAARKIARDVSHRSAIEPRRESVSPAHGIEPSTARSQVHEKRFSATASRGTRNSPRSFSAKTIPPLIPSLRVSTLTRLVAPTRGWPLATASYLAGASQIDQELSNPFAANTGTRTFYIRQAKFSKLSANGSQDHFGFRPFRGAYLTNTFLKFSIRILKNKEDVIDVRPAIVSTFMPSLGTLLQSFSKSIQKRLPR